VLAADNFLVICDESQFLDLKVKMEYMFDVTLQEGDILRFLNLCIIQSLADIIIDQNDHIVDSIMEPYFKDRNTSNLVSITGPFQMDSSFEQRLYEANVLTGYALRDVELQYGGSLFHWNGVLLHVTLTTRSYIGYTIMHIAGYLATPKIVIFEGLEHTMRYLYVYHHIPILYSHRPMNKKSLAMHWGNGTAEYLSPEYGTVLDADHAQDIHNHRLVTSSIQLLDGVAVAWKCKKQAIKTLHSTGSEITSLISGVKKTNHLRDFLSRSLGISCWSTYTNF
jgi:hypothetical protein